MSSGSIGYYRRCRAINNSVTLAAAAAPQRLDKQENPQESTSLGELGGICGKRHIFMRSSFLLKFHIWYNKTIWGRIQCWECYQVFSTRFRSRNWFVFLCMFSVLCLWQCNSLVRTPYCALLMPHSCCQSQGVRLGQKKETSTGHGKEMSFCFSSSIQLRQSLQVAHSINLYVPGTLSPFLALIFFVFVSFVSSAPHTLHYWWPRVVGNIGAGDSAQGGKGHRDLRSNSCYLPPSSCGWTYHWRPNPLNLNPKFIPVIFTLQRIFDFLNVRFSAVVGDTSSIWLPLHFLSSS